MIAASKFMSINVQWTTQQYWKACILSKGSIYFAGVYVSQASFEVYALILALCNVADIPRTLDQPLTQMLTGHGVPLMTVIFGAAPNI
ncbi:hypothetical protein CONPUDRAFT_147614 [Coniophora puteana RWD-64-598 SS2]|uniref:Uncharacterized protein n=1 Tax=Coniophora puteana (strain RWD-64-598) TaxID=741705 RepID=R7SHN4_CONPW|nr:uncharacterized protein CONPUDRAFT_147614 [Coniophora puteana RWD-64-598 SS2]EIW74579.1 hypothetical protein CONPUDRAFT_147614 [Coniophora puteana RWD-64-598 SS2]